MDGSGGQQEWIDQGLAAAPIKVSIYYEHDADHDDDHGDHGEDDDDDDDDDYDGDIDLHRYQIYIRIGFIPGLLEKHMKRLSDYRGELSARYL